MNPADRFPDDERSIEFARDAQDALCRRGLFVSIVLLESLPFQDCIDAHVWARNVSPTSALPSWLARLIASGAAAHLAGWCRECAAYPDPAVDVEFQWADDTQTLCAACREKEKSRADDRSQ